MKSSLLRALGAPHSPLRTPSRERWVASLEHSLSDASLMFHAYAQHSRRELQCIDYNVARETDACRSSGRDVCLGAIFECASVSRASHAQPQDARETEVARALDEAREELARLKNVNQGLELHILEQVHHLEWKDLLEAYTHPFCSQR